MAFRKVKVGWRTKALAFNLFDRMPFGDQVYFFFQRHVTKTAPRLLAPTAESGRVQIAHARRIVARRPDAATLTLLELGAGWDLYANLLYHCYGLNHQIAVDVRRWARAELVNAVIAHLQRDPPPGAVRLPGTPVRAERFEADLLALYGIRYLAPFDATATGFAADSIDIITTTSVFEHVPEPILAGILKEARRILRGDGFMSHAIDYSDHYAHADPAITPYNLLRFGKRAWALANPSIHFQNRLRGADYRALFAAAGFAVAEETPWQGEIADLRRVSVHPDFADRDEGALRELGATFVLTPA